MARMIDLVQRTVTRLSMVAGPAVQLYAEDRIGEMIYHKFVTIRDEMWWDDLMTYVTFNADGQGRPTGNVVRELPDNPLGDEVVINKYHDIQHVWVEGRRDPLPTLPRRTNIATMARDGSPMYRAPDEQKVIRLFPFGTGRPFTLRYRRYFPMFLPDDNVPMDDQVLILGTCYDYLEDDGTNPSQIEKFRTLYGQRLNQLKSAENDEAIPLHSVGGSSSDYQVV